MFQREILPDHLRGDGVNDFPFGWMKDKQSNSYGAPAIDHSERHKQDLASHLSSATERYGDSNEND